MSVCVLYFSCAVKWNTARDRIAQAICQKPKIFRKRNAASIGYNIFLDNS